jgi:serine/threonine protein kinase
MDTKICPYCREIIKIDAVKCKHCQTVLTGPGETLVFDPGTGVRVALAAKYDVVSEIGRGGMAIVYRAVQKGLGRTVALKILPQQLAYDKELLDRFHREARALASLKHASIVPVYDEGFENGIHFFAMEYLEGKSLSAMIKEKGRLSPGELTPIVTQVADALDYIHTHGFIHRDVKSSNIFINQQGVPVLMDFGIARSASDEQLTARGMILGTPEFMSPEQAAGKEVDGRSDLYSLGVVLYQAVTGVFPHAGDTPLMTLHKIVTEPYIPIREICPVPEWLEHAINRCLQKEPDRRVQSGRVLTQLLKEKDQTSRTGALKRPTKSAPLVPSKTPLPRQRKRSATSRIMIALFVVVVLGSIGFFGQKVLTNPPTATVPTVLGIPQQNAEQLLSQGGWKLGSVERRWGQPQQHDLVIEQRPPGGVQASPGSQVTLVIGIGKTSVPELKGLTIQEAVSSLRRFSLALGETTRVAGLPEDHDRVLMMYPRPGTALGRDGKVNLSIGE